MEKLKNDSVLVLRDDQFIGEGASRRCYRHPQDPDRCVKVNVKLSKDGSDHNQLELAAYSVLREKLHGYIIQYDPELVETNRGPGLVCELLRDDDDRVSVSLEEYVKQNAVDQSLQDQFSAFFSHLLREKLNFYDFNPRNFIIQKTAGGERLVYIDIKGYNKSKALFRLEEVFPFMGRRKMKRRIGRFNRRMGF